MSLTLRRELVLVAWESPAAMAAGQAELTTAWAARGADVWSASLLPRRVKGTWRGDTPFAEPAAASDSQVGHGLVAALTYGTVRVRRMVDFYLRGFPETSRLAVGRDSPMIAGIGFARRAIEEGWFLESMFARFAVLSHTGSWAGGDPLA